MPPFCWYCLFIRGVISFENVESWGGSRDDHERRGAFSHSEQRAKRQRALATPGRAPTVWSPSHPPHGDMADGGAGSKDAFRIPGAGEELTYPFSQFVVRYGHTAKLSTSTAALAGVLAELPPSLEVIVAAG